MGQPSAPDWLVSWAECGKIRRSLRFFVCLTVLRPATAGLNQFYRRVAEKETMDWEITPLVCYRRTNQRQRRLTRSRNHGASAYREDESPVADGSPEVCGLGADGAVQERLERCRHGGTGTLTNPRQ